MYKCVHMSISLSVILLLSTYDLLSICITYYKLFLHINLLIYV